MFELKQSISRGMPTPHPPTPPPPKKGRLETAMAVGHANFGFVAASLAAIYSKVTGFNRPPCLRVSRSRSCIDSFPLRLLAEELRSRSIECPLLSTTRQDRVSNRTVPAALPQSKPQNAGIEFQHPGNVNSYGHFPKMEVPRIYPESS